MNIDVMKSFEVDQEGNAMKDTRMISRRDIREVLKDWKKLVTVIFNILATLPVSAFGTFLPLIVKGKLPNQLLTVCGILISRGRNGILRCQS
jgi:hypothetical protein